METTGSIKKTSQQLNAVIE